jgi:nucleoside-diphosphate-sugar epimerase
LTTVVTGATGHLGANLVRALLARGERVRVLVRAQTDTRALDGLDVERVTADLADPGSLRGALEGGQRLYHTAAFVSIRSGDRAALWRVNVDGTRALLRAAREAGIERVVHTSSLGAVGQSARGPSTELDFLDPHEPVMDYERSKSDAEHVVRAEAERGLDVCIVNPSAIVGPYDFRPSLVGRTILDAARGRMRAYVPGAFDWVPMRDAVSGHLLAMEKGRTGERYLLSGEVHSVDQILDWIAEFSCGPRPRFALPPRVIQEVARVKDWVEARYFPERVPRFNYHSIRLLTSGKRASNEKAQRELGLRPTAVREAFRDAIHWFRDSGQLRSE